MLYLNPIHYFFISFFFFLFFSLCFCVFLYAATTLQFQHCGMSLSCTGLYPLLYHIDDVIRQPAVVVSAIITVVAVVPLTNKRCFRTYLKNINLASRWSIAITDAVCLMGHVSVCNTFSGLRLVELQRNKPAHSKHGQGHSRLGLYVCLVEAVAVKHSLPDNRSVPGSASLNRQSHPEMEEGNMRNLTSWELVHIDN